MDGNNLTGEDYEIELFFDGGCPLCKREIALLRRWDRLGKIRFTDIDAPAFSATTEGKTYQELMAEMHGRLPDRTWVRGVEVFRRLYAAVGYRRLAALSRLPILAGVLNWGYAVFAKNRLRLTGRCETQVCHSRPIL